MFKRGYRCNKQFVQSLEVLQRALDCHFHGQTLRVHGRTTTVDEIIGLLRGHVSKVERAQDAYDAWQRELRLERRQRHHELSPLLAALRALVAARFGAGSLHMREFGFQPVGKQRSGWTQIADEDEPSREEADEDADREGVTKS